MKIKLTQRKLKKYTLILFCLGFLLVLAIPFLLTMVRSNSKWKDLDVYFKTKELRKPATLSIEDFRLNPKNLKVFPTTFENFVNDNISLRCRAINYDLKLNAWLFRQPNVNNRAFVGKDDWLFIGNKNNYKLPQRYQGLYTPKYNKLDNKISQVVKLNKEALDNNATFYVFIVPNKIDVYPEFLPYNLKVYDPKRQNLAVKYFIKKLKENKIKYVFAKDDLIAEKKLFQTPLFIKGDLHWNYFGGFVAYKSLMKLLSNEKLLTIKKKDINFSRNKKRLILSGLARYLNIEEDYKQLEIWPHLEKMGALSLTDHKKNDATNKINFYPRLNNLMHCTVLNKNGLNKKKIHFIRDSFVTGMQPYIFVTFTETSFQSNGGYEKLTAIDYKKHSPDIVVLEIVKINLL